MGSMFDKLNNKTLNKEQPTSVEASEDTTPLNSATTESPASISAEATDDTLVTDNDLPVDQEVVDEQPSDTHNQDANVSEESIAAAASTGAVSGYADVLNRPVSSVNDNAGGIKPDFGPVTKTVDKNNILDGVELPPTPEQGASPADVTRYYLDKLNAVTGHVTAGRSVLAELHTHLKENPDTKDLLLPEHLGEITRVMGNLTRRAHGSAQAKKSVAQKKVAVKEEKVVKIDAAAEALGDIF